MALCGSDGVPISTVVFYAQQGFQNYDRSVHILFNLSSCITLKKLLHMYIIEVFGHLLQLSVVFQT